jgi:hypothetical protein
LTKRRGHADIVGMKSDTRSLARGGATAARIGGIGVLVAGLLTSLVVGGFFVWLFPGGMLGYGLGVLMALVSLVVGGGLMLGGRKLASDVERAEGIEWEHRLAELTATRGAFTVAEAARTLGIPAAQADAYLTNLAKTRPEDFTVDLDPSGDLVYRAARVPGPAVRIATGSSVDPKFSDALDATEEDEIARRRSQRS